MHDRITRFIRRHDITDLRGLGVLSALIVLVTIATTPYAADVAGWRELFAAAYLLWPLTFACMLLVALMLNDRYSG